MTIEDEAQAYKELHERTKKFTLEAFDEFMRRIVKAFSKTAEDEPDLDEEEMLQMKKIVEMHIFTSLCKERHILLNFAATIKDVQEQMEALDDMNQGKN